MKQTLIIRNSQEKICFYEEGLSENSLIETIASFRKLADAFGGGFHSIPSGSSWQIFEISDAVLLGMLAEEITERPPQPYRVLMRTHGIANR